MICKVLDGTIGGALGEIDALNVRRWTQGLSVKVIVTESMVATGTVTLSAADVVLTRRCTCGSGEASPGEAGGCSLGTLWCG